MPAACCKMLLVRYLLDAAAFTRNTIDMPNVTFGLQYLQDDNENERGGEGLSKSGKELKILLRRTAAQNGSDGDDDEDTDVMITIPLKTCTCFKGRKLHERKQFCGIEFMFTIVSSNRKMSHQRQYLLQNRRINSKVKQGKTTLLNQEHQDMLVALHLYPNPIKTGDPAVLQRPKSRRHNMSVISSSFLIL